MRNTFSNLKAAFIKYDRWERKSDRLWENAKNSDDVLAAIEFDRGGEEKQRLLLCQAFYEDTKEVNSRRHCNVIDIVSLRRFVANGYSWKRVPA